MIAATAVVTAAVTFDSTVKFVHVVLAIVAVGANLSYGIWLAGGEDAQILRGIQRLHERVAVPAYALLGVTGVVLVARGPWDITEPWVAVSSALYVVAVLVAVLAYSPALRARLEGGASASRATATGGAVTALAVVVTFLMVTKPG